MLLVATRLLTPARSTAVGETMFATATEGRRTLSCVCMCVCLCKIWGDYITFLTFGITLDYLGASCSRLGAFWCVCGLLY